jgi:GNAT superfamily N-acetyltransferase
MGSFAPERNAVGNIWEEGEYSISDDPARLDLRSIHEFLTNSYWAAGIPFEVVKRSIENSLPFGVYAGAQQVGFARVVTDYATFAYIGDVFIVKSHRGRGLSKQLMGAIMAHPRLQGLRRWHLATRDAHGLYRQYGFTDLKTPDRHMEKWDPDVYRVT